jgi:hypothetical protein
MRRRRTSNRPRGDLAAKAGTNTALGQAGYNILMSKVKGDYDPSASEKALRQADGQNFVNGDTAALMSDLETNEPTSQTEQDAQSVMDDVGTATPLGNAAYNIKISEENGHFDAGASEQALTNAGVGPQSVAELDPGVPWPA